MIITVAGQTFNAAVVMGSAFLFTWLPSFTVFLPSVWLRIHRVNLLFRQLAALCHHLSSIQLALCHHLHFHYLEKYSIGEEKRCSEEELSLGLLSDTVGNLHLL